MDQDWSGYPGRDGDSRREERESETQRERDRQVATERRREKSRLLSSEV